MLCLGDKSIGGPSFVPPAPSKPHHPRRRIHGAILEISTCELCCGNCGNLFCKADIPLRRRFGLFPDSHFFPRAHLYQRLHRSAQSGCEHGPQHCQAISPRRELGRLRGLSELYYAQPVHSPIGSRPGHDDLLRLLRLSHFDAHHGRALRPGQLQGHLASGSWRPA